ncbi:MAG: winged helix-turn-helix domain-containing protein [Firmicutes bacterium]|nr:winged helix-turn-helix domain-containing protein [Bacillota bacterium]
MLPPGKNGFEVCRAIREKHDTLTALEFDLFYFLVKNAGQVFKREQLLEQISEDNGYVYERWKFDLRRKNTRH